MTKHNDALVETVKATCPEFCAALTDDEVVRFVRYTRVRELAGDALLADIGEIGERFYLVIGGAVRLLQVTANEQQTIGGLIETGRLGMDSLVGEMSFFDRRPRTVRLTAAEQGATLLEINRQMYNRIRIEEPYIATNLLEFVIRSLDALVRHVSDQNAKLLHRDETNH